MWYETLTHKNAFAFRAKEKVAPAQLDGKEIKRYPAGASGKALPIPKDTDIMLVTDGGALSNGQRGGWGYAICTPDMQIVAQKYDRVWGTTCNRMEIQAVMEGLADVYERYGFDVNVTVRCDSKYAIGILTKTRTGWAFTANKNHDIVDDARTVVLSGKGKIQFQWVAGHSGICPIHELVDKGITKVYNTKVQEVTGNTRFMKKATKRATKAARKKLDNK